MHAKVDIAIIGAGVIGLAIAYELSKTSDKTIAVLEKNRRYGQETSSRNSEVIHSGLYNPAAMLKTRLCLEGNQLLYDFCQEHQIPHKRLGKLIVASSPNDFSELENLYRNGQTNGIEIENLDAGQVARMEPGINVLGALYIPSTGIIDTHRFMQVLHYLGSSQGVYYLFDSEVSAIKHKHSVYEIETTRETIHAEVVINAAGLISDHISRLVGIDPKQYDYCLFPCKGEYYRLKKKVPINHLVYPLPGEGVLGIHITPDIQGNLRLGPNAYYVKELSYNMDESNKDEFYESVKRFLPSLEKDDIIPDCTGIRPKLQGPGDPLRDFEIHEESDKGYPGFINLIGIESPGLTSSLAIARYVKELYAAAC